MQQSLETIDVNVLQSQYFILSLLSFPDGGKLTFLASPKLGSTPYSVHSYVCRTHLYLICDHTVSELSVCFSVSLLDGVHKVHVVCLIHLCIPSI